jgi:hypothetical protein
VAPPSRTRYWLIVAALTATAPLWIAVMLLGLLFLPLLYAALYALVWTWWIGRARRRVLFVYSDSPNWKAHVEGRILPKLPTNTVVLNWSHRKRWPRFAFPVTLFRSFAGGREFNPIGLVFERFRLVSRYRLWQPFRDAKHGRPEALQTTEELLLRHAAGERDREPPTKSGIGR